MKKRMGLMVAALLCGAVVQAGLTPGYYVSQEFGGGILDGRWSEAWFGGNEGAAGSTVHAASWDGSTLGTMWAITGAAIDTVTPDAANPTSEFNLVVSKYYTTYTGGSLTLTDAGPWGDPLDGVSAYAFTITNYSHDTTKYYRTTGEFVRAETDVHLTATLDSNPAVAVEFILAVAALLPGDMGAAVPADYPDFAIETTQGAWGVVQKIQMEIIPEPATMALLGLGGLLLRKRRV